MTDNKKLGNLSTYLYCPYQKILSRRMGLEKQNNWAELEAGRVSYISKPEKNPAVTVIK